MRKPRLDAYDPDTYKRSSESINLSGIVPLQPKSSNAGQFVVVHESASQHDGTTALQHDGLPSRQHDSLPSNQHDGMMAETPLDILSLLQQKATQKTTVRLPSELLQKLEETLYLIKRNHHTRLSMNAIFVAALASFCLEFEQDGENSPLYKLLKQSQQ